MNENKHYYAFISHSSEDAKIALWLRDKLDNYHIPTSVQKEYDVPKSLKPNFTFQTDLAGNKLKEALDSELDDSRFLIVICSPCAARSSYVNGEIQHFIDTHRVDKIIPFIVAGTPFAKNEEEECFPPALRSLQGDNELRGINLKETEKHLGSKMAAVVNVIATMLGIKFDVLWDKYRRRRTRRNTVIAAVSLLFVMLGLFVWDYNRPAYRYFVDYVDCWGVPEGVVELPKEQVSHRGGSYRFEYRRVPFGEPNAYSWRLAKVCYVNSALRVQEMGDSEKRDRYPIQELEYNKKLGVVQRINYCDTKGKVLLRHELSERDGVPAAIADFRNAQEQLGSGFVGASLTSMSMGQMDSDQKKSNIVRYAYERDDKGHIVRQTYHANNDYNLSHSAVSDLDGIFGCQYTLDSLGRRIKVEYLGLEGEKACTKKGVAGRSWEYDGDGNLTKVSYFDLEGNPALNEKMWSVCTEEYDGNGNPVEVTMYDIHGELCLNDESIAKCKVKYDDKGNWIEQAYYGTDGEPCFSSFGCSKASVKYDQYGNMLEVACFDTEGNPCIHNEGFHGLSKKYDSQGNCIEEKNFDTKGVLCLEKDGFASLFQEFDKNGNIVKIGYYGTDGEPCINKDGVHKYVYKYDDRGNWIETSCFGVDGNPCLNKDLWAKGTYKYDDRGNEVEVAYFGTDGKPCLSNEFIAKCTRKFDDKGNQTEAAFNGIDGKPCLSKYGYAKWVSKYDDRGNLIEMSYCGIDGSPCLDDMGVAASRHRYDDRGNPIESTYYGINGEPCKSTEGFARVERKYDNRGNVIEISYFGVDDEPCLSNEGYARGTIQYDNRDNKIEVASYGINGALCLSNNGVAMATMQYDERGNLIESNYFGTDGEPCLSNEGYAKCTKRYDDKGKLFESAFYGIDGEPRMSSYGYARTTFKYDDRGKEIETACFDVSGQRCVSIFGYSIRNTHYNEKGFADELCYLGADSLPIEPFGYYREVRTMNERGEVVKTTYFDKQNKSLGDYCFAMQVTNVSGFALNQGVPLGSVVVQCNDWVIGDSQEKAYQQRQRRSHRDYYLMPPNGEILHLYREFGALGLSMYDMTIEKTRADEWRASLEEWKKRHE